MNKKFSSEIFEIIQELLNILESDLNRQETEITREQFLAIRLMESMNERNKTIFLLDELGNLDGILPLQRTFFELYIALMTYASADDKASYCKCYYAKVEWRQADLLISKKRFDQSEDCEDDFRLLITELNKEKGTSYTSFEEWKKASQDEICNSNPKLKKFDLSWYEISSGRKIKELSEELGMEDAHWLYYKEASEWIHTNRLLQVSNTQQSEIIKITNIGFLNRAICEVLSSFFNILPIPQCEFSEKSKDDLMTLYKIGKLSEKLGHIGNDLKKQLDEHSLQIRG